MATNQFINDSTYFTDSCRKNERIKLKNDNIASMFLQCGAPYDTDGQWRLYADSIVALVFYNTGSGFFVERGIKPSKLISVDNEHFVTKETKIDGGYVYVPGPNNQREEYFTTYKKY